MTESRAQRPTIDQIEDRVSVVKQLRERFKEDKVYLRTLDADLLCLQMTLNWRRGEQKSQAIDNGPIRRRPREAAHHVTASTATCGPGDPGGGDIGSSAPHGRLRSQPH